MLDFETLLAESVKIHGHICAGQVIGVRMSILALQQIDIADLPPELREKPVAAPVSDWQTGFAAEVDRLLAARDGHVHETLTHAVERLLITRALAHTGGRRIEAAHALGIGRNTITRKIHELGLDGGGEEGAHAPA